MPKGQSTTVFRRWKHVECSEIEEFAKTRSNHKPTYVEFWRTCSLVKNGTRTAMGCKNKYLEIIKSKTTLNPGNRPVDIWNGQQAASPMKLFLQREKAKATEDSDDEIEIIREIKAENTSTLQSQLKAYGFIKTEKQTGEEYSDRCGSLNTSKKLPRNQSQLDTPVQEITPIFVESPTSSSWKTKPQYLQKKRRIDSFDVDDVRVENSPKATTSRADIKEADETISVTKNFPQNSVCQSSITHQSPILPSAAKRSGLVISAETSKKYMSMYKRVRSHQDSDMNDIRLMALNIDTVVNIAYDMLGFTCECNTEKMLESILIPEKSTGESADLKKLLMFNIFASHSNIRFVEKFESIGFKLCSVRLENVANPSCKASTTQASSLAVLREKDSSSLPCTLESDGDTCGQTSPQYELTQLAPETNIENAESTTPKGLASNIVKLSVDRVARVYVHDLMQAYGMHRNGSLSQKITAVLHKGAEILSNLNGNLAVVTELVYLRVVSKAAGSGVRVDIYRMEKNVPKVRNVLMYFGTELETMISEGDVVVANGACNKPTNSTKVIFFNPAWALMEVILLKLDMRELVIPIDDRRAIPVGPMMDTFLLECTLDMDYVTSVVKLVCNATEDEIFAVISNPMFKNKILLTFENLFNDKVQVRITDNPTSDENDQDYAFLRVKPLFCSNNVFTLEPNDTINSYFEFDPIECDKVNRLLLMFVASTSTQHVTVSLELVLHH